MPETVKKELRIIVTDPNDGRLKMSYHQVRRLLQENGFKRARNQDGNHIYVKFCDNIAHVSSVEEMIEFVKNYFEKFETTAEVKEIFTRGINSAINKPRMNLLPVVEMIDDMDEKSNSRFFFKNRIVEVRKDSIYQISYSDFNKSIWENRIIPHDILGRPEQLGDFEKFFKNITGTADRYKELQSIVGYLLHRYKNPSLAKAVIFYDKDMFISNNAEGRTGKTLIGKALGHCREVVESNGKFLKLKNTFGNQKVTVTSDLMFYDDVDYSFNLESVFSMITTSIEIERKLKDAFNIPFEKSPKLLISSNSYVMGPGGTSDMGRRIEFELNNYYSAEFTPIDDFNKNFFTEWNKKEWNQFFHFMMECVQVYLNSGLPKLNMKIYARRRLTALTSLNFLELIEICDLDEDIDQRFFLKMLEDMGDKITSHRFTKWLEIYCKEQKITFEQWSTGGNYFFKLKKLKNK